MFQLFWLENQVVLTRPPGFGPRLAASMFCQLSQAVLLFIRRKPRMCPMLHRLCPSKNHRLKHIQKSSTDYQSHPKSIQKSYKLIRKHSKAMKNQSIAMKKLPKTYPKKLSKTHPLQLPQRSTDEAPRPWTWR